MTATELRRNVYQVLDDVLDTGHPAEIQRNGRTLLIVSAEPVVRDLSKIPKRKFSTVSFDELVATTWEWEPSE